MNPLRHALAVFSMLAFAALVVPAAAADDEAELSALLVAFLEGASINDLATHERFWAEDLVYTSSSGERFGKARIVDSLRDGVGQGEAGGVVYSAREIDVRVYGDAAVVAFQLASTPAGDSEPTALFWNTGTFVRRDGQWRAVAWQATRIPAESP